MIAQQGLYFRASAQAQPDWSQVWLKEQFEGKEGAAHTLFGNERYHPLDPFKLPWKLERELESLLADDFLEPGDDDGRVKTAREVRIDKGQAHDFSA